jgi:hypothetical protein
MCFNIFMVNFQGIQQPNSPEQPQLSNFEVTEAIIGAIGAHTPTLYESYTRNLVDETVRGLHAMNRHGFQEVENRYAGRGASESFSSVADLSRPEREVAIGAISLMAVDGKRNVRSLGNDEDRQANRKQAGMILGWLSSEEMQQQAAHVTHNDLQTHIVAKQAPQVVSNLVSQSNYTPRHARSNVVVGRSYNRPSVKVRAE